jgi:tellurite resistance protein
MPPLACFAHQELPKPGIVGRLFRHKPKEHCFIEIQNLLATNPLRGLTAADVENVLSDYVLSRPDANPRLTELYAVAVRHLANDGELSDEDRGQLKHLRYVLGLSDEETDEAQLAVLREVYRAHLLTTLRDGQLSDHEKAHLERVTRSFGLPEQDATKIYKDEVLKVLQQTFDAAIGDRRYSEEEETRLTEMARNLGVTMKQTVEDRAKLERFRQLARIEAGQLPVVEGGIRLQRGETCHADFPCRLLEKRTITKRVNYAGPSGRIRIMRGLSFRYGSVSVSGVTSEEMRQIDTGSLHITNKRLLFNGAAKNLNIPYKKVIGFTMFSDGVLIEKDTGRDQYFAGTSDMELLGAIIDAAISKSHDGT